MFDLNPEDMWMGEPLSSPRPRRGRARRSPAIRKVSYKKTIKGAKSAYKGTKSAYKGAKNIVQYARKGYMGSAETAYKKKVAKANKAKREAAYEKKLMAMKSKEKKKGVLGFLKK